jgi:hypothetical protein
MLICPSGRFVAPKNHCSGRWLGGLLLIHGLNAIENLAQIALGYLNANSRRFMSPRILSFGIVAA